MDHDRNTSEIGSPSDRHNCRRNTEKHAHATFVSPRKPGHSILTLKIGYLKLLAILIANPIRRTPYSGPGRSADRIEITRSPLGHTTQDIDWKNVLRRKPKLANTISNLKQNRLGSGPPLLGNPRFQFRPTLQIPSIRL